MAKDSMIKFILGISIVLWFISMGLIYYAHYLRGVEDELGYISSDFRLDSEERQYYSIYKNGNKIGYKTESWLRQSNLILCREESVIKMNLAGLSREVFFQSLVVIDSTSHITRSVQFSIHSGSHSYVFSGKANGDSLNIEVKKDILTPVGTGTFIVNKTITIPTVLPYFISNAKTENMSFMVFDPVYFSNYFVDCAQRGMEIHNIDNKNINLKRYELNYLDTRSNMWLDRNGRLVKADGYMFFGGKFGNLTIERTSTTDVFRLPVEVSLGNDIIKELTIYPDKPIQNPRSTEYLEVELEGIRAANIDISSSNKEILSINPVIFGIYNKPVITGDNRQREMKIASIDTSIVGTSDYIQTKDARIIRAAKEIISAEKDTLAMAIAINQWVFENIEKVSGLDIIRSVDVYRYLKGDCDEHTKLFTALARSIGIPTQINMGLLYRDGKFRYHSWPSVFADGVWHDLDPTLGQDIADATHLTLVRGDFEKLFEFIRIAEKISIKVLDYR